MEFLIETDKYEPKLCLLLFFEKFRCPPSLKLLKIIGSKLAQTNLKSILCKIEFVCFSVQPLFKLVFYLQRFNRYPLIIDPSGQATEFIMREFKERKITKTSFLDDSFRKNLESALRFGNPLLVQVSFVFSYWYVVY